jgi:hypothetical protein
VYNDAPFSVLNEDMYAHTHTVLLWVRGSNLFEGREVGDMGLKSINFMLEGNVLCVCIKQSAT